MTSFFKINVIGQFLKNTGIYYERRQELIKPISLKNDILFIKMHILKNVHDNNKKSNIYKYLQLKTACSNMF